MNDLEEVIREFVAASRENLDRVEKGLVQPEADPSSQAPAPSSGCVSR
jgi:hypothetical protein